MLVYSKEVRKDREHPYQRCRDRNHSPLIPRLHDGRINALDRLAQLVEVAADELMIGELRCEDVEELHKPRGNVFWLTEVCAEWDQAPQALHQAGALEWVRVRFTCCVSPCKELRGYRVESARVVFEEFTAWIDDDMGLVWRSGFVVVL